MEKSTEELFGWSVAIVRQAVFVFKLHLTAGLDEYER